MRVISCLDHLTLIGFEDKTLILEIIDIPFVHALTIYKEKLHIHQHSQRHYRQHTHNRNYFTTYSHILAFNL